MTRNYRVMPEEAQGVDTGNGRRTLVQPGRPGKFLKDGVMLVDSLSKRIRRQSPKTSVQMMGTHFTESPSEEQALFTDVLADFET